MASSFKHGEKQFRVGDTIRVSYAFREGEREKTQSLEGILMAVRGRENNKMFTMRVMSKDAIGVERIIPVISPFLKKIDVVKRGRVRRAKKAFIRKLSNRQLREHLG